MGRVGERPGSPAVRNCAGWRGAGGSWQADSAVRRRVTVAFECASHPGVVRGPVEARPTTVG